LRKYIAVTERVLETSTPSGPCLAEGYDAAP